MTALGHELHEFGSEIGVGQTAFGDDQEVARQRPGPAPVAGARRDAGYGIARRQQALQDSPLDDRRPAGRHAFVVDGETAEKTGVGGRGRVVDHAEEPRQNASAELVLEWIALLPREAAKLRIHVGNAAAEKARDERLREEFRRGLPFDENGAVVALDVRRRATGRHRPAHGPGTGRQGIAMANVLPPNAVRDREVVDDRAVVGLRLRLHANRRRWIGARERRAFAVQVVDATVSEDGIDRGLVDFREVREHGRDCAQHVFDFGCRRRGGEGVVEVRCGLRLVEVGKVHAAGFVLQHRLLFGQRFQCLLVGGVCGEPDLPTGLLVVLPQGQRARPGPGRHERAGAVVGVVEVRRAHAHFDRQAAAPSFGRAEKGAKTGRRAERPGIHDGVGDEVWLGHVLHLQFGDRARHFVAHGPGRRVVRVDTERLHRGQDGEQSGRKEARVRPVHGASSRSGPAAAADGLATWTSSAPRSRRRGLPATRPRRERRPIPRRRCR